MSTKCDNVISLKQYGPTCWFNSILMSVLYSEESRKLLLEKAKTWNKKIAIYKTLHYILKNKYFRTTHKHNDYLYFDKIRPEYILKQLYTYNKKKFSFNPVKNKSRGYKSVLYIKKVYKLLGVNVLYLDLNPDTKKIYYSLYNHVNVKTINNKDIYIDFIYKSSEKVNEKIANHDIIIINILQEKHIKQDNFYPQHYLIQNELINISSLSDIVKVKQDTYIQDSVLLTNWNNNTYDIGSHSIAGIKCKGEKYVYNGWTRTTIDPNIIKEVLSDNKNISIPCQLMKYDWDLKRKDYFCLNRKKCILDEMDATKLCFSFYEGGRIVTYVKKIIKNNKNINIDLKCPIDKVINPATDRCISIKTINKLPILNLSKPEIPIKICPPGSLLNPITNRCNKIKNNIQIPHKAKSPVKPAIPIKICPPGSLLNPKTNRCNKIKNNIQIHHKAKSPVKPAIPIKKCPKGSVLNPISNRCNKIKNNIQITHKAKSPVKPVIPIKKCPKGSVLNPKTNRCNKIKNNI